VNRAVSTATKPLLLMGAMLTGLYLLTRSAQGAVESRVVSLAIGKTYFLRVDIDPPLTEAELDAFDVLTNLTAVLPVWTATSVITVKTSDHFMIEVVPIRSTDITLGMKQEVLLPSGPHTFTLAGITQG